MRATFVPPDELPAEERLIDDTGGAGADAVITRLAVAVRPPAAPESC
jgi:hypothetical protein